MKFYLLIFLLISAAVAVENATLRNLFKRIVNSTLPKLYVLDDYENPVEVVISPTDMLQDFFGNVNEQVKFYLYTRESVVEKELFVYNTETLKQSFFNPQRETKFVTHGWMNSKRSDACKLIKDAFLKRGDYNVVVVDWSAISVNLIYPLAASKVLSIGKRIAKMIDFLAINGMDLTTLTLVGHSLGAHAMGLAGHYSKGQVNYIVGLDPALPLFALKGPGRRISTVDAKHVEIIHTNAGFLGYMNAIGKADFYPNGGTKQAGCIIDLGGSCSHSRSYKFFAESLLSEEGFYGRQCTGSMIHSDWCKGEIGLMGDLKYYLPYKGRYYIQTNNKAPFAKGLILP